MEDGNCLFVLGGMIVLGIITVGVAKLFFNNGAPVSHPPATLEGDNSRATDPWVERGLKDEDANLTIKGIAYLDGLDSEFDGRFDGPSWP